MEGKTCVIAGKQYTLYFNNAVYQEIARKFGGIAELDKTMKDNPAESLETVHWVIALMANQGTMIETHNLSKNNPDFITAEYVSVFTAPGDMQTLVEAMREAIELGMKMEHSANSGPVDVVLEELRAEERKNGESGETK